MPIYRGIPSCEKMRTMISALVLSFVSLMGPVLAQITVTNLQVLHKIDKSRCYAYPNGWGSTPEAARKDLDRVMDIYKDRPGYFRHSYVKVVPVSKTQYEADGCVSFFAPDAKLPKQQKGIPNS